MADSRLPWECVVNQAMVLISANLVCAASYAQVFSGPHENGSIVLSNFESAAATTLLMAAEKVPILQTESTAATAHFLDAIPAAFKPFIQEASETFRVPQELIHAVITVESNYNPLAQSPRALVVSCKSCLPPLYALAAMAILIHDKTSSPVAGIYAGYWTSSTKTWN